MLQFLETSHCSNKWLPDDKYCSLLLYKITSRLVNCVYTLSIMKSQSVTYKTVILDVHRVVTEWLHSFTWYLPTMSLIVLLTVAHECLLHDFQRVITRQYSHLLYTCVSFLNLGPRMADGPLD